MLFSDDFGLLPSSVSHYVFFYLYNFVITLEKTLVRPQWSSTIERIEADISALDIYYIIGKDIGNVKNRVSSKSRFMSGHDESKYQLPINLIQQTFEILTFPKKYVHKFLVWFLWLSFGVRFWPVNNQTKSRQALNDIQTDNDTGTSEKTCLI